MTLKEKVAYLKGLTEGLALDPGSKEGKLFLGILDAMSDMAEEIEDLGDDLLDIDDELEAVSDDLNDLRDFLFDDEEDEDDDYFFGDFGDFDDDDDYDEDGCDCEFCGGGDLSFQIVCPKCSTEIELTDADIASGTATCPSCSEKFELDFDDEGDDEEMPF